MLHHRIMKFEFCTGTNHGVGATHEGPLLKESLHQSSIIHNELSKTHITI